MSGGAGVSAGAFVGRDALVAHVARLVAEDGARLVTLRGTVGVGKARLATEIAKRLVADRVVASVAHVELREIDDAETIARVIERASSGARGRVCLVLEGCERGRDGVVRWIEANGARASDRVVIATSRERLGLTAEHVVAVEPLEEDDAVGFFESLVTAARGTRASNDPTAGQETRALVRRVSGVPLVLELAAAQAVALSMRDLLAREDVLLDLLASPHPRPRRHEATLRDAMEAAWRPLDAGARRVLAACAQYEGPFVLADVEAIAGRARPPVARQIARLVDASLVSVVRAGEEPWMVVHLPLRVLARESAGDDREAFRSAWARHVLEAARPIAERAHVSHASSPIARFRLDFLAIARDPALVAIDGDDVAARTLGLLARSRGPVDSAIAALDGALTRGREAAPALRARLHHLRGVLFGRAGDAIRARADLEVAGSLAEAAGDARLLAQTLADHGDILRHAGDFEAARIAYERAVDAARARDPSRLVLALGALASMAHERGENDDCARRHDEVQSILRDGDDGIDPGIAAIVHQSRGTLLAETGDHEGAERAFRDALAAHRASGNRRFEGIAEHDLGCLALEQRRVAVARAHLVRAEGAAREVGDRRELGLCHALLGACDALVGEQTLAEAWLASAETLVHQTREPASIAAFEAHRAQLVALELRRRRQRGEPLPAVLLDELRGALDAAEARASQGDEVRLARRVLAAEAARILRTDRTVVAADGSWFVTARTGRVSLAKKDTLARLLAALVGAHRERPLSAVSAEAMARAGWPATRALTQAAKNRLHVAIASMRKLGLGDALVYGADGYRLVDVDIGD